jgi:hypothetical protein
MWLVVGISYEIPPEALEDADFRANDHGGEKYLGYPYVWGGSSRLHLLTAPALSAGGNQSLCWQCWQTDGKWSDGMLHLRFSQ